MSQISVTINGKTYRMACDEGQENHLIQLSQKFDGYVGQLKGSFGEIGDQRLTIMAGIMVVDELTELQKKMAKLELELEQLTISRDDALSKFDAQSKSVVTGIGSAAERLEGLARKLNGL